MSETTEPEEAVVTAAEPPSPEALGSFTNREWRAIAAGVDAGDDDRATAAAVEAGLGEELGHVLNAETLVVLTGSGTSLGIQQADGSKNAPSMGALWDDVSKLAEFSAVASQLNQELIASKNLEHVLSDAQARQAVTPDPAIDAFIAAAEEVVLTRCCFVDDDTDVDAHEMFLRKVARRSVRLQRTQLFTTNYDLVFETAARRARFNVIDGFGFGGHEFDGGSFDLDYVRRRRHEPLALEPSVFHLLKLHGSVDWSLAGETIQKVTGTPSSPVLIYPSAAKYQRSYQQPHLEFMSRFQIALRQPDVGLIVVGFGFNDDHLNAPIEAALRSNIGLRATIVTPGARAEWRSDSIAWIEDLIQRGDHRLSMFTGTFDDLVKTLARGARPGRARRAHGAGVTAARRLDVVKVHPFTPERQIGVVYQVEGLFADVSLTAATKLPRAHFGERLGRGEVGEFVVIDVGGTAAFGRLLRVGATTNNIEALTKEKRRVPVEGRIQLLSTLHLDGTATRGVLRYPKVGDPVYAASTEAILDVLQGSLTDHATSVLLGRLSVDDSVEVGVPLGRLFGRHLAIVGATGSGKSWTLAHLAEQVDEHRGKMLIIDATGEYHTLDARAHHLAFGSLADEPKGTVLVGIPHHMMREADRNAFLNPSSGTQLPKLRDAVRSLRLAWAIANDSSADPAHTALLDPDGTIQKKGREIAKYGHAARTYTAIMEDPHAPFSLSAVAKQIQWECVWPTARNAPDCYGDLDYQQIGYVSTLVSRINDLVQTPEVIGVIDPPPGTADALAEIATWLADPNVHLLRISLRNLTFANHLREIVVNIMGQALLGRARNDEFRTIPLVVAIDEAHQFFDVTVGDEFANTRLNAFDAIAKEGRKYGLSVCVATQRPSDLPVGVLSQVGMSIVHRLADGRDRQRVEQAAAELDHSATRLLPGLDPGEAILMGVDFPVPVSVRMTPPTARPASDGPRYENWA